MEIDRDTRPKNEAVGFIAGIMLDAQKLISQQMALFRHEIDEEVGHAREAGSYIMVGAAIAMAGFLLLCLMVVHLLAALLPGLPLWACFGIVGIPLAVLGGAVCLTGIRKFNRGDVVTAESTMDLKEKYDA